MKKNTFVCSTALLISLLTSGFATASEFDAISLERLRTVKGAEGIGFGSLVVPTWSELGKLSLHLYDDQDVALYWVNADMSFYLPTTYLPIGRMQFGGIEGELHNLQPGTDQHPSLIGFVEGTWSMNGQGVGTISAVAFRIDGDGQPQPFGVINGEFLALEIVLPQVEAASPSGTGDTSPMTYRFLTVNQQAQQQVAASRAFPSIVQKARDTVRDFDFARRPADLELRIREARAMAKKRAAGATSVDTEPVLVPTQVHLAGKILAHYKIAD